MRGWWLCLFLWCSVALYAQDMMVLGRIVDERDGRPIAAANVWIKGSAQGAESNEEGYFFLRMPTTAAHELVVSVVGYKRRTVQLTNELDQWVEVKMSEETLLLDELVVLPGENPALALMRRVRECKPLNDPEYKVGRSYLSDESTDFGLFNVNKRWLQRRFLRDVASATLQSSDSSLIVPLYRCDERVHYHIDAVGEGSRNVLHRQEHSLQAVGNEPFRELLGNYVAEVNFYKNNLVLFGRNFVSPLSNSGNLYYKYYMVDSLSVDGAKQYVVRFTPKNAKDLAFKGEMRIDSLTCALVDIDAQLLPSANINYVSDVVLRHGYGSSAWGYVPRREDNLLTLNLNFKKGKGSGGVSLMYKYGAQTQEADSLASDTLQQQLPDTLLLQNRRVYSAIDSLNKTRLQRLAQWGVDLFLHGYVHAWKFDIGPLVNIYRYNRLEGHRVTLGVRTGEAMMKHATVGGFVGYGFGDKRWKYGVELQTRFGSDYRHRIGLFFSDNVEEYGMQHTQHYLKENFVGDASNIISSIKLRFYTNYVRVQHHELMYRYERSNVAFTTEAYYESLYANSFVPFTAGGESYDRVNSATLRTSVRLAFGQRYIDGFFHRYYLYNTRPVLYLQAEYGRYGLGGRQCGSGGYGKLVFAMRHAFPLLGGSFRYRIEAGHVIGQVPWMLLDVARRGSGFWISESKFSFMQPMEFITDTYSYFGFTYFTKGFLFNWIPGVKKLNLREVVSLSGVVGTRLNPYHSTVLDFPKEYSGASLSMPYIEMSVGIANILRVASVESVWRVTHRSNPNAALWGMRVRFNIDF